MQRDLAPLAALMPPAGYDTGERESAEDTADAIGHAMPPMIRHFIGSIIESTSKSVYLPDATIISFAAH